MARQLPLRCCKTSALLSQQKGVHAVEDQSSHVYKQIELVGSSPDGIDAAVKNALERAAQTLRNLRWFEVVSIRGGIEEQSIREWQVTLKAAFVLE
jgi:dodecin